jgi:hypothetical protein
MMQFIFGKLTFNDLPHQWFTIGGTLSMVGMGLFVAVLLTRFK